MRWDGAGNVTRTDGTRSGVQVWQDARDADEDIEAPPTIRTTRTWRTRSRPV